MENNSTENNKDKSEYTENINEDNRVDTENNCNTDKKMNATLKRKMIIRFTIL